MIGVDLVHIPEFARQLRLGGETFLRRAFHVREAQGKSPEHLAGLWAAKEAVAKAAGLEPGRWLEIELWHEPSGRPRAQLGAARFDISIAHHGEYAVAVAQEVAG